MSCGTSLLSAAISGGCSRKDSRRAGPARPPPGISDGFAHATFQHLYSLERFGIRPGLHRIRTILEALNRPERNFAVIHIAGTKRSE